LLLPIVLFAQGPNTDTLNLIDKRGRKQGTWEKKYPNNKVRYHGQFTNDKPVGVFQYFDNYGTLTGKIVHTKNDTANVTFYHDGVSIMSEGTYFKMQRTGVWKFYDGQGDITSQTIFVNGKKHGMSRVYYKDGRIAKEVIYENGILQGIIKEFFANGRLKFTGLYRDGNLEGKVEWFHPNGAKKVRGYYKYAVQVNAWTYYDKNNKPTRIEFYKEGKLIWTKTPEQLKAEKELKKQKKDSLNSTPEIKE